MSITWNGIDRRRGHPDLEYLRDLTNKLNERDSSIKNDLEKFKLIANLLPVGVWYCNKEGYASYVNDTWCNWAGMEKSECIGNGWLYGLAAEDKIKTWEVWQESVQNDCIYKAFYRIVNQKYGSEKKCFALGRKVNEENWVGITIDLDDIGESFYAPRK